MGFASVESTVPSALKSQAYVIAVSSGSRDPSEENLTVSGAGPDVRSAESCAIGVREPCT